MALHLNIKRMSLNKKDFLLPSNYIILLNSLASPDSFIVKKVSDDCWHIEFTPTKDKAKLTNDFLFALTKGLKSISSIEFYTGEGPISYYPKLELEHFAVVQENLNVPLYGLELALSGFNEVKCEIVEVGCDMVETLLIDLGNILLLENRKKELLGKIIQKSIRGIRDIL